MQVALAAFVGVECFPDPNPSGEEMKGGCRTACARALLLVFAGSCLAVLNAVRRALPYSVARLLLGVSLMLALDHGFAAELSRAEAPTPPVTFPLQVSKAGSSAEIDVQIQEAREYRFIILFPYRNLAERARVAQLVGVSAPITYRAPDGRMVRETTGVMIPLHLTIHAMDGQTELVKDERYDTRGREGFGAKYYARLIAAISLQPGLYRIRLEALQDTPEVSDIETSVTIYTRRH